MNHEFTISQTNFDEDLQPFTTIEKDMLYELLLSQYLNNGHNVLDIRGVRNGCHYLPAQKEDKHMGDIVTCLNKIWIKRYLI